MPICANNYSGLGNYTIIANTAARPTGGSRVAGTMVYQVDINTLLIWDGTAWRGVRSKAFSAIGIAATTSSTTALQVSTLTVPDQGVAGTVLVWVHLYFAKSVATDNFFSDMAVNAGALSESRPGVSSGGDTMAQMSSSVAQAAGAASAFTVTVTRQSGSGTASAFADGRLNRIDALFVPT